MEIVSKHDACATKTAGLGWLRRLGLTLGLSISLGAISNILVAWTVEYFGTPLRIQRLQQRGPEAEITAAVPGAVSVNGRVTKSLGCETRYISVLWREIAIKANYGTIEVEGGNERYALARPMPERIAPWNQSLLAKPSIPSGYWSYWMERGTGYPFVCLYKWQQNKSPLVGAIELPDPQGEHAAWSGHLSRGLPFLPIWPALMLNTILYAGLWSVPLFALPVLGRWRRRRRGLCAACGYDLSATASNAACPECGQSR